MTHLVVAADQRPGTPGSYLAAAFRRLAADPSEGRLGRVTVIDLGRSPVVGRFRSAMGLGWQAREHLKEVERKSGRQVDGVVEVGDGPFRHLMGLGRTGVPTARWTFIRPDMDPWAEVHVAEEGVRLFCGHRASLARFRGHGATWLPPACADEVLALTPRPAGMPVLVAPERKPASLDGVVRRLPRALPDARADALTTARLLVHADPSRRLTARFMEAIGSGAPVVTTVLDDGAELLFDVNRHVLLCDADDLAAAVARFRDAPWTLEVGRAGRERVLAAHRYEDRARTMLGHLFGS